MGSMKSKFFGYRVKASSLLEVTIALIIISIVFTLASSIYGSVQKSLINSTKLNADIMLTSLHAQTVKAGDFTDLEFESGELVLQRFVLQRTDISGLREIRYVAKLLSGKIIREEKHLVYADY
jgi:hypothetical protein